MSCVLTLGIIAPALPSPGRDAVLHVDDDAPLGGDGTSWDTAYRFLQDALANAEASGGSVVEIRVAQGTYYPDEDESGNVVPDDRAATFHIVDGVALVGGFAGIESADPDERDVALYESILSGEIGETWFSDNSRNVLVSAQPGPSTEIDGFTITRGNSRSGYWGGGGAGLHNTGGTLAVTNCRFVGNHSYAPTDPDCDPGDLVLVLDCTPTGRGAGVYNIGGNLTVTEDAMFSYSWGYGDNANAVITSSTISGDLFGGNYTIDDCVFDHGSVRIGLPPPGPWPQQDVTLTNCTFQEGHVSQHYGPSALIIIDNCHFVGGGESLLGNRAHIDNSSFAAGASIAMGGESVITGCTFGESYQSIRSWGGTIDGCTFSGNDVGVAVVGTSGVSGPVVIDCVFSENGHGVFVYQGFSREVSATVIDCVFINNGETPVHDGGGGIRVWGGAAEVTVASCEFIGNSGWAMWTYGGYHTVANCLFAGNSDGAVIAYPGDFSMTILNCTVVGNSGTYTQDGGLRGQMFVGNSIVRDNHPSQIMGWGGDATVIQSNVQGGWTGAGWGNIDEDPLFVDPANGDFRLSVGSPCIDAGANNAIADLADTDLVGNPRFADDPATADTGCGAPVIVDMGAYEYQGDPASVLFGDINGDGRVGVVDLVALIQCVGSGDPDCCVADLDLDGEVGMSDMTLLMPKVVQSVPFGF
jgi:hypothetical protein